VSLMASTGDRLRRATQLWHCYLAGTGKRFELAQFLRDEALEKQVLASSLASRDPKLVKLAQDWLRDSGRSAPAGGGAAVVSANAAPVGEGPKPGRYLRGVR
jgi:hypothetical protein